jgi:heptaprenylglyceryl phosphate synthase
MITKVKKSLEIPLIVGGGIRTPEAASKAVEAGADVVVTGTIAEKNPEILEAIIKEVKGRG